MYKTSVQINSQCELTWVSIHSSSYAQLMEHRIERINIFQFLYGKLRGERMVLIRTKSRPVNPKFSFYWIRTILLIIISIMSVMSASAKDNVTREGNIFTVETVKAEKKVSAPEATVYKVKIKEQEYIIYKGPKGGFFFYRTSKDGKRRKEYITQNNYPEIHQYLINYNNEKD